MILFELKLELWKIIQWNKIEFGFQIKPNSDRILDSNLKQKARRIFPTWEIDFSLSSKGGARNFGDKSKGKNSATRDKEERKRFPRWRFCNYLKTKP